MQPPNHHDKAGQGQHRASFIGPHDTEGGPRHDTEGSDGQRMRRAAHPPLAAAGNFGHALGRKVANSPGFR